MVVPEAFAILMQRLNHEGRKKVRLLKDRELQITTEAEQLIMEVEDYEIYFLHRKFKRS